MAANRGTITITASVLPDDIKKTISGQIIYDLNDIGSDNKWVYYVNNVSTTAQSIMPDSISYFANAAGDEAGVTDASDDDIGLLILQHSGFRGDGVTKSTDKIYFNITHTIDANAGAVGDMILKPGEIWWA